MERLDYVGVLAVEFFVMRGEDGREVLLANEMAPRVHNSGHWTIEGAETSQFENHVRACVGLPLGPTGLRAGVGCAGMVNLIGGWPEVSRMLGVEGANVHLYGKSPRDGRKVGHVTVTGATAAEVRARMEAVEALL
jgi:5-(carboxyamino)imidazole ribonucleotide synthase